MNRLVITLAIPGIPFNGETFDKLSIGGSESAGYYMARALAKLGHSVTVFCNTDKVVRCADVDYMPLMMFRQYVEFAPHDVCIVQRDPSLLQGFCQAKFTMLWCHDLAMRSRDSLFRGTAWNYDKTAVLSEFQRDQYKQVFGLLDSQLFLTRNGLDLDLIASTRKTLEDQVKGPVVRNPLAMLYSVRPERGLDVILTDIMPRILKEEPGARLFIATYDNPVDQLADFYSQCDQIAASLGKNVVKLGSLTKSHLYTVMHSAGLFMYPVPSRLMPDFDEVSCISAMEAQGCGLPIVTSARGALPETIAPEAGRLIGEPIHTEAYADAFAQACLHYMRTPDARRSAESAGLARAATLGWDDVAKQWNDLFISEIKARSSNLAELANHFWRRSDIYAAEECLRRLPEDDQASAGVRNRIREDWGFIHQPEGFRKQYEKIGSTHTREVINYAPQEPRYRAVREWLAHRIAELPENAFLNVLDYGCAHGAYATNLLKELPRLRVTGVDIDLRGIQMAYEFAEQLGVSDRWRGVVGDVNRLTDPDVPEMREMYDVVIAQEVLEHVADPDMLIANLDQRCKNGGRVWLTTPFGPWEYSDYRRYPYRAHVWDFDLHDLHDLLDLKGPSSQLSISVMPYSHSSETDDALGWHVTQYIVTDENRSKVGSINMERKISMQRPRQTVSGALMLGPGCEETLHWCLKSLVHVVDELVIADCGLSEEARRIIAQYRWRELDGVEHKPYFLDVKVIPGGDPKTEGFETPRNRALEHCTQSWILWVDGDEKLLQPEKLHKYLRPNVYDGYSIRQHHFSVDADFGADLPVRLFRNRNGLRWYGMIHEHPEKGLNEGPGQVVVLPDVHIPHVGYLIESGRRVKFSRNLPMLEADEKKYPGRLLQKHFLMRDKMLIVNYTLQQNGGRRTPEVMKACQEVRELYRTYFLGKGHFTNVDPLEYYSQANSILGEGFDAVVGISTDKVNAQPNGALKARFASKEDFVAEVTHRAGAAASVYDTRYW